MNFRDSWRKYKKDWIFVVIVIGITTVYTFCYLSLNPQSIPSFLVAPIIAMIFVALMALMPKKRQRLVKAILAYNTRQKEMGGWLYRYQKITLVLFFIIVLTFPLLWQYQYIPSQYLPWSVLTFLIVTLALGAVNIAWFLKATGKWGLLLIAIIALLTALRILIWRLSQST